MKYSEFYQTRWHDTDACRRIRPSQLLVYMQETSGAHVSHIGMSLDKLRDDMQLAYLLSKIRIAFYRPLSAFEDIEVRTWTTSGRGFSSGRFFQILKDGEVIAEADSTWALVGTEDRRLHRAEEAPYPFEHEDAPVLDLPSRVRFPAETPLLSVGERRIVYSDLDYNMHMNNTRYPDMLCDFLPLEEVGRIKGMTLSYLHEAAFGDTITVLRAREQNSYFFRTVNQEGVACLEAQIVLE